MTEAEELELLELEEEEARSSPKPAQAPVKPGVRRVATGGPSPDFATEVPQPAPDNGAFGEATPAVMGVGKGASLGFIDEISGALSAGQRLTDKANQYNPVKKAIDYATEKPLDDLQASDLQHDAPTPGYTEARNTYRQQEATAKEQGPKQFLAGEIGGSMLLPVPGPGKGVGLAKKVGYAALTGGALGAAGGAGASEAEDVPGLLKDTGVGGLSGAAAAGTFTAAGGLARRFVGTAEGKALKAAGAIQKDLQKISPEEQQRIGRTLLNADVIQPFAGKESILQRAEAAAAPASSEIGAIVDKASATPVRVSGDKVAGDLRTLAGKDGSAAFRSPYRNAIAAEADVLGERLAPDTERMGLDSAHKQMSARDVSRLKQKLQGAVNYAKRGVDLEPIQNQARGDMASVLRKTEEDIIERALGPEELQSFQAAKSRYGDLQAPIKWAAQGMAREGGNNVIGQTAANAGGAVLQAGGANLGSLTAGGAAAIAIQVAKQRGDAAAAVFLNSIDRGDLLPVVQAAAAAGIRSSPVAGSAISRYFSGNDEGGR